jgi:hypothetical protein
VIIRKVFLTKSKSEILDIMCAMRSFENNEGILRMAID